MASISKNKNSNKKLDTKSTKYYIATDNALMNEIQELLTDQEIISKKLIEENNDDYNVELIFPEEITKKFQNKILNDDKQRLSKYRT